MRISELDEVERRLLLSYAPGKRLYLAGESRTPSLRTLRLRKRADPLPPWYAGRDVGELDYLPLDPLPPVWPPCECCGKPTSTVRNYADGGERAVCHECTTMLRFAGLDIYAISTTGGHPLPADWHRLALPSQRGEGAAYASLLEGGTA